MRPRLLDLFCGAGGAAMGYHRAGFDVYGVDSKRQPHYPFPHHVGDALAVLDPVTFHHTGIPFTGPNGVEWLCLADFDVIHASPPPPPGPAPGTAQVSRAGRITDIPAWIKKRTVIDPDSGCWLWTGAVSEYGYANTTIRATKTKAVHRISFEVFVGPIPAGMQIDHACHDPKSCDLARACPHRRCCNPEHLELVTPRENNSRSASLTAVHGAKTHCPQGHPYDEENTYRSRNRRACKECQRGHNRAWKRRRTLRRRAEAAA